MSRRPPPPTDRIQKSRQCSNPKVRSYAALAQPSHEPQCVVDRMVAPSPIIGTTTLRLPSKVEAIEVKVVLEKLRGDEQTRQ